MRTEREHIKRLGVDAPGLKCSEDGHSGLVGAMTYGDSRRSKNYSLLGHARSNELMVGPFGVAPTGLAPTLGIGHPSSRNHILIPTLTEFRRSSPYANAPDPAFNHQNLRREPPGR